MERFRKIQQWIGKKSDIFKCILVIPWMLWALIQCDHVNFKDHVQKGYDLDQLEKVSLELTSFYNSVIDSSLLKGKDYGPKDYYSDLRRMEEKRDVIKEKYPNAVNIILGTYSITPPQTILQDRMNSNFIRGTFDAQELSRQEKDYWRWMDSRAPKRELNNENRRQLWNSGAKKFFNWFWILYLRTLPFVFFWYLVGMCMRRGILETILADKKKFLLAMVFWPVYVWLYPANVIRQIRVEAEFRRVGNLFRRFSNKDRLLISQIANSEQYAQWLKSYRLKNEKKFQHGILVALLVTIVFSMAIPVFCLEFSASGIDPPSQSQKIVCVDHHAHGVHFADENFVQFAIPEPVLELVFESIGRFARISQKIILQEFVRCIEHVPIFGSLDDGEVFHLT